MEKGTTLPLVEAFLPTADGKGRLFVMEPGKRIELDFPDDQWRPNDIEDFLEQLARVSLSPEGMQKSDRVKAAFIEECLSSPTWKKRLETIGPEGIEWLSPGRVR